MRKVLSCGVIYICNNQFLIGHVTNSNFWSLPKGINEQDEHPGVTAARELFEETGIRIDTKSDNYHYIGIFKYCPEKDLCLFMYEASSLVPVEELKCISMFENSINGKLQPEIDKYMYTTLDGAKGKLLDRQYNILKDVFLKYGIKCS